MFIFWSKTVITVRQATTVIFVIALLLDPHVEVQPPPAVNDRSISWTTDPFTAVFWFDSVLFSSLLFPDS